MTFKIFSFFDSYGVSSGQGRTKANCDTHDRELEDPELIGETEKAKATILAQFYTAEYSAMMTRVSAWANLQYAPWPILVAALGLVSQMQAAVNIRVWLGAILTLVVYVAYQGTMVNSLYYVLLIERYLRKRASRLVQRDDFWIHERVFQRIFPQNPGWWPYWPPVLSFTGIALVAAWSWYVHRSRDWVDAVGLSIALSLGVFIVVLTRSGKRLKNEIIEACKDSEMVIDEPTQSSRSTWRGSRRKSNQR